MKLFCQVVEQGSISQVARTSYVTQPAVTSKIRQLEKHYGVALFDRTGGMLRVTKTGSSLYPYAKEIVGYFNRSEEVMNNISNDYEEPLHIGASLTIGEYLLPDILGKFQKKHKQIQFSLAIGNTPTIMSKLENLEIDIALVEGIVMHRDFQIKRFAKDELILVIPRNHRWNSQKEINIEELAEERILLREKDSGARKIIETILAENNVLEQIHSYIEFGSTQAIKSAVESGHGIGILPKLSVTHELELGVVKHLPISNTTISRDLWIVKRPTRFPKNSINLFNHFLKEAGFNIDPSE
nr:LysR family transcriptional regulator [Cytobacillus citreus]